MAFDIKASALLLDGIHFVPKPFITGWNRLEGRVRAEEFERALRAEARDPLWFLARQWQFLELKADDAGSPIETRVALRTTRLARFAMRDGPARSFPTDQPLEAIVEREPPPLDRVALIQIHRALEKALARDGLSTANRETVHAGLREAYPFDATKIDGVDDEEAAQLARIADPHLFDAATFLADPDIAATIDAASGLTGALAQAAKTAATAAKAWYQALYLVPDPTDTAWEPSRLEYRFSCATEPGSGQTVLVGDSYAQGRLDWFAVDIAVPDVRLGEPASPALAPLEETLSFLPTAISFAGMPSHRFWEMEDRRVEFGAITTHTTDIAKLLLIEFMLAYANDWCVIPFEVEVGTICDTLGLVVHDVFGDATLVRAADRGTDEDWRRWAMFGLETRAAGDTAQPRLFVPPSTPKLMESAPLESVVFLRDEMANLCWAAERTILSAAGIGVDGERFALSHTPAPDPEPLPASTATARYRVGTDAPLNWRPFIPVRIPGSLRSVRLQRARLPRDTRAPLGVILVGPGLAPQTYFINEEEIPRAGRIVTRSFQRTRWLDGRVVLWLGRRTLTGRGEGNSGLAFDVLQEVPAKE
jgi:hypothetical protein